MQRNGLAVLALGLMAFGAAAESSPGGEPAVDKISYAIGVDLARNFRKQSIEFNPEATMKGMKDALAGSRLHMTDGELRRVLYAFQAEVRQKLAQSRRVASEENRKKGQSYLDENRKRDGVIVLPSGLQYRVLKSGHGRTPTEADMVECNYRGTLLDATEFDGTEPGHPATLKVSALIAGWKEALKLMPEGSRWQLVVPPQLAYGERGVGNDIGPNETLLFEVDLVAVK